MRPSAAKILKSLGPGDLSEVGAARAAESMGSREFWPRRPPMNIHDTHRPSLTPGWHWWLLTPVGSWLPGLHLQPPSTLYVTEVSATQTDITLCHISHKSTTAQSLSTVCQRHTSRSSASSHTQTPVLQTSSHTSPHSTIQKWLQHVDPSAILSQLPTIATFLVVSQYSWMLDSLLLGATDPCWHSIGPGVPSCPREPDIPTAALNPQWPQKFWNIHRKSPTIWWSSLVKFDQCCKSGGIFEARCKRERAKLVEGCGLLGGEASKRCAGATFQCFCEGKGSIVK